MRHPAIEADPHNRRRARQQAARLRLAGLVVVASLVGSVAPSGAHEHTIEPGEALSTIAARYGVAIEEIAAANRIEDPDLIIAGTRLVIPGSGQADSPATHTVAPGETAWELAGRFGVPLGHFLAANDLPAEALIYSGQVLVVPAPPPAGQSEAPRQPAGHVVEAGESLWSIADRYGVELSDLVAANELDSGVPIVPGQEIAIPRGIVGPDQLASLPADLATDPGRLALMSAFDTWSDHYGVPRPLLKALAYFESGWNNDVRSSAGAIGVGQILPITADFVSDVLIGAELDPTDAEDNIRISARYLRYLLDETGDVRLAIASYYQGLTATRQHGIYLSSNFYVDGILALRPRFD